MNTDSFALDAVAANPRVKRVRSFAELVSTAWGEGVNALCWPRQLEGDFEEIVKAIGPIEEITGLDEEDLRSLDLSAAGQQASQSQDQYCRF